ncbi:hypothetical protein BDZ94DRAFT_1371116 [Collybia nuda]|uniref:Uncharacterized protein n=1 Tax=Collybia nuda TaxID=64659 RepID=A0A9P6CDC7_9AGAR|nr:hypothetical protein BDZ94DRAFT_1371116 [Collybia nuda]
MSNFDNDECPVCLTVGCRLEDTLEIYLDSQPLGPGAPDDAVIDLEHMAQAFSAPGLRTALDTLISRRRNEELGLPVPNLDPTTPSLESEYGYKWQREDGTVKTPDGTWTMDLARDQPSALKVSSACSSDSGLGKARAREGHQPRRRGRGKKNKKKEGHCVGEREPDGSLEIERRYSLLKHHVAQATIVHSSDVSLLRHGSRTLTGWSGRQPPKKTRQEILEMYLQGRIAELLSGFNLIPHME